MYTEENIETQERKKMTPTIIAKRVPKFRLIIAILLYSELDLKNLQKVFPNPSFPV
jgi:hypothetical protein